MTLHNIKSLILTKPILQSVTVISSNGSSYMTICYYQLLNLKAGNRDAVKTLTSRVNTFLSKHLKVKKVLLGKSLYWVKTFLLGKKY